MQDDSGIRRPQPVLVAATLYLVTTGGLLASALFDTGGELAYALDDAYIHLAVARTIAEHGVIGPSPHEVVGSVSSLLWGGALAGWFALLGVQLFAPLLLNVAAALGLLFAAERTLAAARVPHRIRTLALLLIVAVTPLPGMTLVGMEHTAHALATLLFLHLASNRWVGGRANPVALSLAAAALCSLRYEGAFAVLVVAVAFVLRARVKLASIVALAGALPLVAFGAYLALETGEWLPNSLLLKGKAPSFSTGHELYLSLGGRTLNRIVQLKAPALLCILAWLSVLLLRRARAGRSWQVADAFAVFVLGTALLHLQFAGIGQLGRYEAYLVATGIVAVALQHAARPQRAGGPRFARIIGTLLVATALSARAIADNWNAYRAVHDRYVQHVVTARFLREHYGEATIALHDLGAVAFYTDARILDLFGLGSNLPVRLIRGMEPRPRSISAEQAAAWLRDEQAVLALVMVEWRAMAALIPAGWVRVAEWRIPRNVVFGDHRLGFYAPRGQAAERLRERLGTLAPNLPAGVELTLF